MILVSKMVNKMDEDIYAHRVHVRLDPYIRTSRVPKNPMPGRRNIATSPVQGSLDDTDPNFMREIPQNLPYILGNGL